MKHSSLLASIMCSGFLAPTGPSRASLTTPTVSDEHIRAYGTARPEAPRSGVWYEIFVRSWYDTNDDGIGDLN
ncbi:MAG: hypothetical protein ABI767_11535, partial [Rhodanobacter sp.]